jgi:hypothetical protein
MNYIFLVGAAKSGTSFLHNLISSSSKVCDSEPKEPYFFELMIQDQRDYLNSVYP